jgi:hypothetical protein
MASFICSLHFFYGVRLWTRVCHSVGIRPYHVFCRVFGEIFQKTALKCHTDGFLLNGNHRICRYQIKKRNLRQHPRYRSRNCHWLTVRIPILNVSRSIRMNTKLVEAPWSHPVGECIVLKECCISRMLFLFSSRNFKNDV